MHNIDLLINHPLLQESSSIILIACKSLKSRSARHRSSNRSLDRLLCLRISTWRPQHVTSVQLFYDASLAKTVQAGTKPQVTDALNATTSTVRADRHCFCALSGNSFSYIFALAIPKASLRIRAVAAFRVSARFSEPPPSSSTHSTTPLP